MTDSGRLQRGTLSREGIIAAGLSLVDEGEELTIRSLASRLGAKPMSLYAHITDRDDLIDGMVELVLSEIQIPEATRTWQEFFTVAAGEYRRALLHHAPAVVLVFRRPAAGTSGQWARLVTEALTAFRSAGLDDREAVLAYRGLAALVVGLVLNEVQNSGLVSRGLDERVAQHAGAAEFLNPDWDASFNAAITTFVAGLERRRR